MSVCCLALLFIVSHTTMYVPSSGVWRVTTVLKGPIPTDVDAAIIQK